jgi:general stress protein YciG
MQKPEHIRSDVPEGCDSSSSGPVDPEVGPEPPPEPRPEPRRRRGFATMDEETVRRIARAGGRAAHERGHAHRFSSEEARRAGRKGGYRVSKDRAHMVEIGRLGGLQRWRNREESTIPSSS